MQEQVAQERALRIVQKAAPSEVELFDQRWQQFKKYSSGLDSVTPTTREGSFGQEIAGTIALSAIIIPIVSEIAKRTLSPQIDAIAGRIQSLLGKKKSSALTREQISKLAETIYVVMEDPTQGQQGAEPNKESE